jgi:hypothetical protein
MKSCLIFLTLFLLGLISFGEFRAEDPISTKEKRTGPWSREKAWIWYKNHPWINGSNFIPSSAVNQLEMWQEKSFDPLTIDRELGYAEGLGMNTMRVFLHSLAWKQDPSGFKRRVSVFLKIAQKHGISPVLVFFDDCWNKEPRIGDQPLPKPGIHNSGWMQDPGQPASEDSSLYPELEKYVKNILYTFRHDSRILVWDLYNEPGNSGKGDRSLPLLKKVFVWAHEVNPDQPLSAGVWDRKLVNLYNFQIENSDIITYHNYSKPEAHDEDIQYLKTFGRPLICTEYMARKMNSRFENIMPLLKKENIGAINWGLVSGKTNTIYAWDTPIPDGAEPAEWFHDIFRKDGSPYKTSETDIIKKLNGK